MEAFYEGVYNVATETIVQRFRRNSDPVQSELLYLQGCNALEQMYEA